jgi:hypothetical protein
VYLFSLRFKLECRGVVHCKPLRSFFDDDKKTKKVYRKVVVPLFLRKLYGNGFND